jgi:imidazolonepropionase-like amidohydrolase
MALLMWMVGSSMAMADCRVLVGGELHLSGGVEKASLVIDQGRIVAISAEPSNLASYASCEQHDITGRVVTAGLVETVSHFGLVEVGLEKGTRDMEGGGDPIRAALRIHEAYNPQSSLIPVARIEGITSAVIAPSGGRISGQAAWVDLAGERQSQAVIEPFVAMQGSAGASSKAQGLLELEELLDDARLFAKNKGAWQQNRYRSFSASRLDLQALEPVIKGERPLVLSANRASAIEALVRFAQREKIRLVIVGAAAGWKVAELLASAQVAVIVDPLVFGPGSFGQIHAREDNAALLVKAGVAVMLSSFSTHNARTLRQVAGNAVRSGMAHSDALKAITKTPADVFGVADRGVLAVGAVANLVVWSGDPFELATHAKQVIIAGQVVSAKSRQTELRERYRHLPGTPLMPIPLEQPPE